MAMTLPYSFFPITEPRVVPGIQKNSVDIYWMKNCSVKGRVCVCVCACAYKCVQYLTNKEAEPKPEQNCYKHF